MQIEIYKKYYYYNFCPIIEYFIIISETNGAIVRIEFLIANVL